MKEEFKAEEQKRMNRPKVRGSNMREIYMAILENKRNSLIDDDDSDEEPYEFSDPDCYCE